MTRISHTPRQPDDLIRPGTGGERAGLRVLVAYASCHGSTAGIAERIAARLRSSGDTIECRPMGDVSDLSGFDATVLGSALHDQAWLPEAMAFLARFADALDPLPLWLFTVGMPGALPRRLQRWARMEEGQTAEKLAPLVHPKGHHLFSGVIRKEHLGRAGRFRFRLMGGRYGDFRNWDEVDRWADALRDELHTAGQQPTSA